MLASYNQLDCQAARSNSFFLRSAAKGDHRYRIDSFFGELKKYPACKLLPLFLFLLIP